MKPIELNCPECSTALSLDAGFAGGVCRCTDCGSLMTVPSRSSNSKAEKLKRPDRPDGPPDTTTTIKTSPKDKTPPTGTYVTASGKSITITKKTKIPTAKKLQAARYTTIGVFALIMLLVLGGAGFLGYKLIMDMGPADEELKFEEAFAYDPKANPLTLDSPHIVGLPIRHRTLAILDLSEEADWQSQINPLLTHGFTGHDSKRKLTLVAINGHDAFYFKSKPTTVSNIDGPAFEAFLQAHPAQGQADLSPVFKKAIKKDIPHVVFICGRSLSADSQAQDLLDAARLQPELIVDVIMIDSDSVALDDLSRQNNGRYIQLSSTQIQDWIDQARE